MMIKVNIHRLFLKKYIHQVIKILRTPYWKLALDNDLNYEIKKYQVPKPVLNKQNDNWMTYEVMGFRFFWPADFANNGLKYLLIETFAPYLINPHAFETNKLKIEEGDWVIDAGACEGFFTFYALQHKSRVLAIEPVPRLAEALKLTFHKEIEDGRVIVLNVGIGRENGISQLQTNNQEIYNSSVSRGNGEDIPVMTLDEILRLKIIPTIDFIKMDIEGGEVDAVLGAKEVLEFHPRLSIAVYHSYLNALTIKKIVKERQPEYKISYRGIFIKEEFGPPRPYMLHAY